MLNYFKKKPKPIIHNEIIDYIQYHHILKITLIGDCGVGKTSIISKFTDTIFSKLYFPTIGVDFTQKVIKVNNTGVKIQLWDTSGQELFKAIRINYYKGICFILLVFDLSDFMSFNNLIYWLDEIKKHCENYYIFLIGTKKDIDRDVNITNDAINHFVKENNIVEYYEISSKKEQVDTLFENIIKKILIIKENNEKILKDNNKIILKNNIPIKQNKCCFI